MTIENMAEFAMFIICVLVSLVWLEIDGFTSLDGFYAPFIRNPNYFFQKVTHDGRVIRASVEPRRTWSASS